MPTRFLDKHRRAKRASRRLHLAFWLGALVSYLCYLIIIVPLFIFMAALFMTPNATGPDAGINNLMMLVLFGVAVIAVFLPVFKLLKAYNGRKRELGQQSAGEQAEALGGSPARPDDEPLENRYVNLVAELSLAAGIPAPAAYVLRDDDSINAFALSGAGDSLALAVSRGALDNLTRDELQAVLGHEFGHIENGDPALYNRLSAMLAGYFATGSRKEQERLYTDPDTQVLSLSGLSDSAEKDQFGINISILYLYGRLLQAAFARRREAMADARAVQYTRDPAALIGALQKAWALQQQGIHRLTAPTSTSLTTAARAGGGYAPTPPCANASGPGAATSAMPICPPFSPASTPVAAAAPRPRCAPSHRHPSRTPPTRLPPTTASLLPNCVLRLPTPPPRYSPSSPTTAAQHWLILNARASSPANAFLPAAAPMTPSRKVSRCCSSPSPLTSAALRSPSTSPKSAVSTPSFATSLSTMANSAAMSSPPSLLGAPPASPVAAPITALTKPTSPGSTTSSPATTLTTRIRKRPTRICWKSAPCRLGKRPPGSRSTPAAAKPACNSATTARRCAASRLSSGAICSSP